MPGVPKRRQGPSATARPSSLALTMPVAARKPRPVATAESGDSCTSGPLAFLCHCRKNWTVATKSSHLSVVVPSMQWTRVLVWPQSIRRYSLSSRSLPSSVRSSSLSSSAPRHWRSSRLWSSFSSFASSPSSCIRSPRSCSSCRRSASVSMQTSILPCMYLRSSLHSSCSLRMASCMFPLSPSHCLSSTSKRSAVCVRSSLSWWASVMRSRISWMLSSAIFSCMLRSCRASSFLSRVSEAMLGFTSSVIRRSTFWIIALSESFTSSIRSF
mmetsp:Transcript_46804/g.133496  ORF Transcript_46804/g.133496 Transcript_46804/m.133496 type:complete len:270 (+) Transcript_46804:655-1464(+)